MVLPETTK